MDEINIKGLLQLVADSELEAFAKLLDCNLVTSTPRKELAEMIQSSSRTRIISALIAINGVWLTMMRDVVQFLESHNVSMRTTGCVIALPINDQETRLYLSPQIVDFIASFDESSVRGKKITHWAAALTEWRRLHRWILQTIREGMPEQYQGGFDFEKLLDLQQQIIQVRAGIQSPSSIDINDIYEDITRINYQAAEQMFYLWRTLDYLKAKLESLEDVPDLPKPALTLKAALTQQATHLTRQIAEIRRDSKLWRALVARLKRTDPWSGAWTTEELFRHGSRAWGRNWDNWVRFIEDVLALANLEKSKGVTDLLQLDLLKDRPRMFEVWCMALILSTYRSWGCTVELASVKHGEPPVWNLNFSRASRPVAHIKYGDKQWWFFYQLFKTGIARANMPDLAVLNGQSANSDVLWIADPKYSEAGSYSRKDYTEVAERYSDAFQPQHTWICEFFPRREWFGGDSYETGDRISILSEVQPKGEGVHILQSELRRIHNFPLNEFVLAVDCSESFINKLPRFEMELQKLAACAVTVICFAGEAKELDNPTSINFATVKIESGTYLKPLVATLEALSTCNPFHTTLVMITDGAFSDSSDELQAILKKLFVRIEQVEDESSLNRIVAEYCKAR